MPTSYGDAYDNYQKALIEAADQARRNSPDGRIPEDILQALRYTQEYGNYQPPQPQGEGGLWRGLKNILSQSLGQPEPQESMFDMQRRQWEDSQMPRQQQSGVSRAIGAGVGGFLGRGLQFTPLAGLAPLAQPLMAGIGGRVGEAAESAYRRFQNWRHPQTRTQTSLNFFNPWEGQNIRQNLTQGAQNFGRNLVSNVSNQFFDRAGQAVSGLVGKGLDRLFGHSNTQGSSAISPSPFANVDWRARQGYPAQTQVAAGQQTNGSVDFDGRETGQRAYQSFMKSINDDYDRRQEQLESKLASQGLTQGSTAYQNAMKTLYSQRDDARNAAYSQAMQLAGGLQDSAAQRNMQNMQYGLGLGQLELGQRRLDVDSRLGSGELGTRMWERANARDRLAYDYYARGLASKEAQLQSSTTLGQTELAGRQSQELEQARQNWQDREEQARQNWQARENQIGRDFQETENQLNRKSASDANAAQERGATWRTVANMLGALGSMGANAYQSGLNRQAFNAASGGGLFGGGGGGLLGGQRSGVGRNYTFSPYDQQNWRNASQGQGAIGFSPYDQDWRRRQYR